MHTHINRWLERVSEKATKYTGSSAAVTAAVTIVVLWLISGPFFGFSDTWQLVINTGTTIVTFLMVFLIQRAQNKESKAIQLKLNEIVAAIQGASNHLIDVEDLSEKEIETLRKHYGELARLAAKTSNVLESHSIEEARDRNESKSRERGKRVAS